MNKSESTAKMRVLSVFPQGKLILVVVEVTAGAPCVGMILRSPEISGQWRILSFGFGVSPDAWDRGQRTLTLQRLKSGPRLQEGMYLVQVG